MTLEAFYLSWFISSFFSYYILQYFSKKSGKKNCIKVFNDVYFWGENYDVHYWMLVLIPFVFYIWLFLKIIDIGMSNVVDFFVGKQK